jgi:serine/threonine protein kinase
MTTTTKTKKKLPILEDIHGAKYSLIRELARGGQGVVYRTEHPTVLVKGFTSKDAAAKKKWRGHIEWLIRQDIADLKLARPLTLLKEPRMGYVMELMDGLVPLKDIFDRFIHASDGVSEESPAPHIQNYLDEGGLRRRIRILAQLARTLNQLHSRGMLYGDLSPDNVFISADPAHAETWLIDCDNISFESHSSVTAQGLTVHTPDYGAPEVVRGDAMLSSLTDCWSFAVIAYQLLTHNHPLKGDFVNGSESEVENEALRGEHPWINDPDDIDNACFTNLPIQLIENSKLPRLFQQTFGVGKATAVERPSMSEWLEALTEVDEHLFVCHECKGQTVLSLDNEGLEGACCFFCDSAIDERLALFEEFIRVSEQEKQDKYPELNGNTIATGRKVCLQMGDQKELKRLMPSFSYDKVPTDHIHLEYTDTMLIITPVEPLSISRGEGKIQAFKKKIRLKVEDQDKNSEPYCIHLGDPQLTHTFWQFRW